MILPATAAGSTKYGYLKVTDDLRHGKVITEEYRPVMKQVTKDYQNRKVITTELVRKKTTTKDYLKGTVTTKNGDKAKMVTEDNRKGLITTERHERSKSATIDCRTPGKVVTRESHHSSKEVCPMKTKRHLEKGKAHRN